MNSHPLFLLLLNAKFQRAAPQVAGLLVKIFVWVLEMPEVGWVLLYILKKDNLINKGAGYLPVAAEAARRRVAWTTKKKKSARRSGWAAALGLTVDALVTSVHGGGAAADRGLAQLPQQSAWPWRAGVATGDASRTTSRVAREPWNRRPSRCRRGGAGGRRRSSPP
ncbi:hypothetical protein ACQJBY_023184 [Aegilops geniculata]